MRAQLVGKMKALNNLGSKHHFNMHTMHRQTVVLRAKLVVSALLEIHKIVYYRYTHLFDFAKIFGRLDIHVI